MIAGCAIHGHAIVSADDRIADAAGRVPPALRNEADWRRFQEALDRSAVTVLGRLGHQANSNPRKRNRLVLSSSALGVERRSDAWWWNPDAVDLAEALAAAAPDGGDVAVVGGRRVFDYFLAAGYDRFDLARIDRLRIPAGIPVFSEVRGQQDADAVLTTHGMKVASRHALDVAAGVSLTIWAP